MNDFNAILGKMRNLANAASKKTEEVVEASKLKLQIVSLNGEISKAYEELGRLIYDAAKKNESIGEEMDAAMAKIDELLEKVAELEGKENEIKKVRTCGNCGASCAADAAFCSRCGVILKVVTPVEAEIVEEPGCDCCCDCDCECEHCCEDGCECDCEDGQCHCHNEEKGCECHCSCNCESNEESCDCCECHCSCDCENGEESCGCCEGHKHEGCNCEGSQEGCCCHNCCEEKGE